MANYRKYRNNCDYDSKAIWTWAADIAEDDGFCRDSFIGVLHTRKLASRPLVLVLLELSEYNGHREVVLDVYPHDEDLHTRIVAVREFLQDEVIDTITDVNFHGLKVAPGSSDHPKAEELVLSDSDKAYLASWTVGSDLPIQYAALKIEDGIGSFIWPGRRIYAYAELDPPMPYPLDRVAENENANVATTEVARPFFIDPERHTQVPFPVEPISFPAEFTL